MDPTDSLSPAARRALGESRRCIATNRAGERCGRYAIVGGFVCAMHGGNTALAQRARKQRLQAMVDPAMAALLRALETGPPCPMCGRSDSDRDPVTVKAAQLVLDRAGFHPTLTLKAAPAEDDAWTEYLSDDELAEVQVYIQRAKDRMARGEQPPAPVNVAAEDGECLEVTHLDDLEG